MSILGSLLRGTDTVYALRLLRLMTMPYTKTKAFKLGLIDADGHGIKSAETTAEKRAYTPLHRIAFNLRRILQKVPIIGRSILTNYAAALFLLKEESGLSDDEVLMVIAEAYDLDPLEVLSEDVSCYPMLEKPDPFAVYSVIREDTGETVRVTNVHQAGEFKNIPIYNANTSSGEEITVSAINFHVT